MNVPSNKTIDSISGKDKPSLRVNKGLQFSQCLADRRSSSIFSIACVLIGADSLVKQADSPLAYASMLS